MPPRFYSVQDSENATLARSLSLPEAFDQVMALAGHEHWVFMRTARVMHLVMIPLRRGDPAFESTLAVDRQARNDTMAQVCAHGFGRYRVVPEEEQNQLEANSERAA